MLIMLVLVAYAKSHGKKMDCNDLDFIYPDAAASAETIKYTINFHASLIDYDSPDMAVSRGVGAKLKAFRKLHCFITGN